MSTGGQDIFFGNIIKASKYIETDKIFPFSDPPGEIEIAGILVISGAELKVDQISPFTPAGVIQIVNDMAVNGTLQTDLIESLPLPGPVSILDTVETTGISFDSGTNVLGTYLDWTALSVFGFISNTVSDDTGTLIERVGDKVTINLNITFVHTSFTATEISGLFIAPSAPVAIGPEVCAGTMLVSELPPPLTSRTCQLSMIPTTNIILFRVEGGGLPLATHRIFGTLIYRA